MDQLSSGDNATVLNSSTDGRFYLDQGSSQHLDAGHLNVVVPAVLGVLCIVGLACNLTAMAILISNAHKGKLSLINSLIFNLMFADGLLLAFSAPLRAAAYHKSSWTLGWWACKTADWFFQSCMAAKSFTVAIMAKACYRYVSNPTKQVSIGLGSILVVLLFTWLSACSVTTPHWLFAALQRERRGLVCVLAAPPETRHFMSVYVKVYPLVVFCAPLSFSLLYFWKAYGRCQRRSGKTQNLRAQIKARKLTLMVFSLTVAMALLWVPHWVVWVWERHLAESERGLPHGISSPPLLLSLSAQLLTFSLSLVNPLVVLSLSDEFGDSYRGLWRRLTLRRQPLPKPKPKFKPGPHTATPTHSPLPRRETLGQLRADWGPGPTSSRGPEIEHQPRAEAEADVGGRAEAEKASLREGIVLPDVEQFWQEREMGSLTEESDPVPWEHQSKEGRK